MRVRNKNWTESSKPSVKLVSYETNSAFTITATAGTYYYVPPLASRLEHFEDDITKTCGKMPFKPCLHTKVVLTPATGPSTFSNLHFTRPGGLGYRIFSGSSYTGSFATPAEEAVVFANNSVSSVELAKAIDRIRPEMSKIVPGLNIYEIAESVIKFKDLLKVFDFRRRSIKNTSRSNLVSEKYLGYSFGVAPTLSDIQNIHSLFLKLDGYVSRWNDMATKSKTMNFHVVIKESVNSDTYFNSVPQVAATNLQRIDTQIMHISQFKAILSLYIKPHRIVSSKTNLWLKALSLDKISSAWAVIPYSWLIDYFFNVGEFLKTFDNVDRTLGFTVVDFGYSTKTTTTSAKTTVLVIGTEGHQVADQGAYVKTNSTFQRIRLPSSALQPYHATLGWRPRVGLQQASYLLALSKLKWFK